MYISNSDLQAQLEFLLMHSKMLSWCKLPSSPCSNTEKSDTDNVTAAAVEKLFSREN